MALLFITLLLPFMLSAAEHSNPARDITITTHNASGKIPLHVARLSFFMRNYMEQPVFAQTNAISLNFSGQPLSEAFELELLIPFLIKAEETLIAEPISSQGSYVQLASEKPLASVDDPEKLLKLFIACDYLQFDFNQSQDFDHNAIIKAIALKMVLLNKSKNKDELFTAFDTIAAKHSYNFQDSMWPYIFRQGSLKDYHLPRVINPCPTVFRDLLVHEKYNDNLYSSNKNLWIYSMDFSSINLTSLQGIEIVNLIHLRKFLLNQNSLMHIPNLDCPELELLNLSDNRLTAIPQCYLPKLRKLNLNNNNIAVLPDNLNNFPNLRYLNLCNNPITEIPETLKRPGLTIEYGKR